MYSKEELLNLLASRKKETELEILLAELEIGRSVNDDLRPDVYAAYRGGTVYYKWNKQAQP